MTREELHALPVGATIKSTTSTSEFMILNGYRIMRTVKNGDGAAFPLGTAYPMSVLNCGIFEPTGECNRKSIDYFKELANPKGQF